MMRYTPGPWTAPYLGQPDAKQYSIMAGGDYGTLVATVHNAHDANARLIAAAPTMLQALKMVVEASQRWAGVEPDEVARVCKQAITYAEGKAL